MGMNEKGTWQNIDEQYDPAVGLIKDFFKRQAFIIQNHLPFMAR